MNYILVGSFHAYTVEHGNQLADRLDLKPISERLLHDRLKKPAIILKSQKCLSFSYFLSLSRDQVISADKMIIQAKGLSGIKNKKTKESFSKSCAALIIKPAGANLTSMDG
jgi:hypothetical protein